MTRMTSSGKKLAQLLKIRGVSMGKAQKIWNTKLSNEEKHKLLHKLCKATPTQIAIAIALPWSALSLWMRMAMKKYWRRYKNGEIGTLVLVPEKGQK